MIELHPEILRQNGQPQFAIFPWAEFLKIQEALEDAADLACLNRAIAEDTGEPGIPFDEVKRMFAASDAEALAGSHPTLDRT